ncbi:MAG: carbohydrate binding domain-containing protein [Oscillospiraceae bacterium]|nr:carbohydrate binding domain-containing protein [Oscillospiraceae bacterium]
MFKLNKAAKSCIAFTTAFAMTAGMTGMLSAPGKNADNTFITTVKAATTATVDLSKTYQYIRGFGGIDLREWQPTDSSWSQTYQLSDTELPRAFGNSNGQLGLSVLRVYVNPDKNQWKNTLKTAQYAQKMGATIFATPWEPPANLAENGSGGIRGGKKHLPKKNYAAYAQHLNDFLKYMKSNGVNVYSISVQNEPDYAAEWTAWSSDETTDFLANYAGAIDGRVMSPETFQYTNKDYYSKILNNGNAMKNCDLFGTHFYGTQRSQMDFPALESSGKEIWMTEVYVPNSEANSANRWPEAVKVAENIHNGLVVGNMSAYVWWYIKRSYSLLEQFKPGTNQFTSDGGITKRGYMMAQFSKYVRPGYRRTEVTEQPQSNVLVSAYKGENNKVVIIAINKGSSEVNQQFAISGQTITSAVRYRTTGSENLAETKMTPSGGGFNAQLPGNSVSTFVCTISGSHGTNSSGSQGPVVSEPMKPDTNGYYYHDTFENGLNDWAERGSVKAVQSGRSPFAGTEALVVSDRTAAWNGVQKNLPGDTFKAGEKFCFSACVNFLDADVDTEQFSLTLQYKDSSGTAKYANIDSKTCTKEHYVQLYNPEFQIPAGATDCQLVVETAEGLMNFYVDEVIVAKAGTVVNGPKEQEIVTTTEATTTTVTTTVTTTEATTAAPVTTTVTTTTTKAPEEFKGDSDGNGVVNSLDLVKLVQHLISVTTIEGDAAKSADMNNDGKLTIIDAIMLKNALS